VLTTFEGKKRTDQLEYSIVGFKQLFMLEMQEEMTLTVKRVHSILGKGTLAGSV
jgi:hypothetical protein